MNKVVTQRQGYRIGLRSGRLTGIGEPFWTYTTHGRRAKHVVCQCDCGRVTVCLCDSLVYGYVTSCGACDACCYVYQFRNRVNGKRYIGSTTNPANRERQHRSGYGASLVHRACQKYGNANLVFKILRKVDSIAEGKRVEYALIERYKTWAPRGYNGVAKKVPIVV